MPAEAKNVVLRKNNISDFNISIVSSTYDYTIGTVVHCQSGMVRQFRNFIEMALLINRKLDEVHFPEAANEVRSWANIDKPSNYWEATYMDLKKTDASVPNQPEASFLIKILYRQNSDWQGTIQWLDGEKSKRFRSFLEMVVLMQEALSLSDNESYTIKFQTWDDKEDEGGTENEK